MSLNKPIDLSEAIFAVEVEVYGFAHLVYVPLADVPTYNADPDAYVAAELGAKTKEEYVERALNPE
jgi:hypothetical protein